MKYTIENRSGDFYAVLEETYKGKSLCVNLSTVLKTETVSIFDKMSFDSESTWVLEYNQEEEKLFLKFLVNEHVFAEELNIDELLEELVHCLNNNIMLNNCDYLNNAINKLYDTVFFEFLKKNNIIFSNNRIIKAKVNIYGRKDEILGTASRFILTTNHCYLLEYVGKNLSNNYATAVIDCGDKETTMSLISMLGDCPDANDIKYYDFSYLIGKLNKDKVDNEDREICYMPKLPNRYSSPDLMYQFIITNNSSEDIVRYKTSVKPKVKLLNINKFMVAEFCV